MLHPTNSHPVQHQQTSIYAHPHPQHLHRPLRIRKILIIRHTLRHILRISLHAHKALDIRERRLYEHVVICKVGKLRVKNLVHLLAGSAGVVDL